MTHVITTLCVDTKDQSCVEVCPVDCIHPSSDGDGQEAYDSAPQLYINPEECIDCGACVPECPVSAIFTEDELPEEYQEDLEKNAAFYQKRA